MIVLAETLMFTDFMSYKLVTNSLYRLHSCVRSYKNCYKLSLLLRLIGKLRIL